MRNGLSILMLAGVSACSSPPVTATNNATAPIAPFTAPTDPGQIKCATLSNPTALTAGTEWALGHARAAVLSGRIGEVPTTASVSQSLVTYCGQNPTNTLWDAVRQIGI